MFSRGPEALLELKSLYGLKRKIFATIYLYYKKLKFSLNLFFSKSKFLVCTWVRFTIKTASGLNECGPAILFNIVER
jgi:hypothetical protein